MISYANGTACCVCTRACVHVCVCTHVHSLESYNFCKNTTFTCNEISLESTRVVAKSKQKLGKHLFFCSTSILDHRRQERGSLFIWAVIDRKVYNITNISSHQNIFHSIICSIQHTWRAVLWFPNVMLKSRRTERRNVIHNPLNVTPNIKSVFNFTTIQAQIL